MRVPVRNVEDLDIFYVYVCWILPANEIYNKVSMFVSHLFKVNLLNNLVNIFTVLCYIRCYYKLTFEEWDVAPCTSYVNRLFRGAYFLHLQSRKIREQGTRVSRWLQTYLEDGGDKFLRNVDSHKIYTAPHPRRRHSL
jgi:hypothetical protein